MSRIREEVKQFSVSRSTGQLDFEKEFEILSNTEGSIQHEDSDTSIGSGGIATASILFGVHIGSS